MIKEVAMKLSNLTGKEELYELGPSRALQSLLREGLTVEALRTWTPLEWRVVHRKDLPTGTSVLRYAVTGDRATRLIDRVVYLIPDAKVKCLGETERSVLLELDLKQEGHLHVEVMFDPNATDEFDI